jgi:hypothetical protein
MEEAPERSVSTPIRRFQTALLVLCALVGTVLCDFLLYFIVLKLDNLRLMISGIPPAHVAPRQTCHEI